MPDLDILAELNRWLAITPEYALTAPPLKRHTLVAAVREIRSLRERVATLEQSAQSEAPTLNPVENNHELHT